MVKVGQIKYPYSLRILEERLLYEQKCLIALKNQRIETFGCWGNEPALKNIDSCEHRISELTLSINDMKELTYTAEECVKLNSFNK